MAGRNIGVAVYRRGEEPGTLEARWSFGNDWGGPGLATGGSGEGFGGRFHIRYFLENGEFSDEYDLEIVRRGVGYEATWLVDGTPSAIGVGIEVGDQLAVGWRRVGPDELSSSAGTQPPIEGR